MPRRRILALLASLTCGACGPVKNDPSDGLTEAASTFTGPSDPPSTGAATDPDVTSSTAAPMDSTTLSPTTGSPTTAPGTTTTETDSETFATDAGTGTSTTAASTTDTGGVCDPIDLMTNYGAPCEVDADCVALIAPGARCLKDLLGVYDLPGGYCSNDCALPDSQTTVVKNAADCFLGADCIGLDGYFEACALECQCDADCPRDGYECRRMPVISKADDPKYCLMTDDNML
jgi:hypothetical protein